MPQPTEMAPVSSGGPMKPTSPITMSSARRIT
jgi:hypothetical protein